MLEPLKEGLKREVASNPGLRYELPWDRYMRLSRSASAFRALGSPEQFETVLDVGGLDGAISLFLPEYSIDLLDPATTGGDVLQVEPLSYDAILAVDVLEHVEPRQRGIFLTQLARVAKSVCVLNYPLPVSATAQKLVAALTEHPFVIEHVKYGLPYSSTVQKQFEDLGFECSTTQHTSRSVWATYMCLQHSAPEVAATVSRYLIEEHEHDQVPDPLYETLVAVRR